MRWKNGGPVRLYVVCDNDNPNCANPEHLFLGTRSDNHKDSYRKGRGGFQKHPEHAGNRKLDMEKARAIRASSDSAAVLAERYGVSRNAIWHIRSGKRWAEPAARAVERWRKERDGR